jgi:hypothetical protein
VFKTVSGGSFSFLDRSQLVRIKRKAMRAGVWFRALPRIDRALLDLTISVAQGVRSVSLARCLRSVLGKLESVLESRVSRAVREVGFPMAQKLSVLAQTWGNAEAASWAHNRGFVMYLAVVRLNG